MSQATVAGGRETVRPGTPGGPVWAVVNYLIGTGFELAGHGDWAQRICGDTGELIAATGFHEAYNPLNSAPSGGDDFSWTAAIWLHWAARQGA